MIVADAGAESTEDVALQNTIKNIKTKKSCCSLFNIHHVAHKTQLHIHQMLKDWII